MNSRPALPILWVGLALIVATGGCDSAGVRLPVSGRVYYQGKPLPIGTIEFESLRAVGGGEVRQGKYRIPAEHGLPPGVYRVSISSVRSPPTKYGPPGPEAKDAGTELIPPEFNVRCEKTIEVQRGAKNQFDFDIP